MLGKRRLTRCELYLAQGRTSFRWGQIEALEQKRKGTELWEGLLLFQLLIKPHHST